MLDKKYFMCLNITALGLILLFIAGAIFTLNGIGEMPAHFLHTSIFLGIVFIMLISNLFLSSEITNLKKLFYIVFIVVIGLILALLFCFYQSNYLDRNFYPFNTILFIPQSRFSDFTDLYIRYYDLSTTQLSFMPAVFLIPKIFTVFSMSKALFLHLFLSVTLFFVYTWKNIYNILKENITKFLSVKTTILSVVMICVYPFLFCFDRGNLEMTLLLMLILFVFLYQKQKYMLSAIVLALAISMKFYPFLFLVLFLSDKKYKEFFFTIGLYIVLTLIGLAFYPGGYLHNLTHFLTADNGYTASMVLKNWGLEYNTTLYGLLKYFFCLKYHLISVANFTGIYKYIGGIFILLTSLYVIFIEKSLWKKLALIAIMRVLFVFVSANYSLLLLIIPMYLFLKDENHDKNDIFYATCFGLILIPYDYLLIWFQRIDFTVCVNIGVIILPLILSMLWGKIIYDGMKIYIDNKKLADKNDFI